MRTMRESVKIVLVEVVCSGGVSVSGGVVRSSEGIESGGVSSSSIVSSRTIGPVRRRGNGGGCGGCGFSGCIGGPGNARSSKRSTVGERDTPAFNFLLGKSSGLLNLYQTYYAFPILKR